MYSSAIGQAFERFFAQRLAARSYLSSHSRSIIVTALASAAAAWYGRRKFMQHREQQLKRIQLEEETSNHTTGRGSRGSDSQKKKVAVNKEFFQRLLKLLKIVFPGIRSKEFALLSLHTAFLVSRTFVSIYVAQLDGSIVKSIVDRDILSFIWQMSRWLLIAIPATYINSMIRYLESKLSIAFRTRLVDHVYTLYMKHQTFYRVDNVDSRLQNPDQGLTEDVARFCADLAHIYSQLSKPCFDIVLMVGQLVILAKKQSGTGMQIHYPWLLAGGVVYMTFKLLKYATPPFGKLVAEEARHYGHLRAVHARLITHSEEVAFYGGQVVEEHALRSAYRQLITHINYIYKLRIPYIMLEQFLMKYVWGATGLLMIAIPTLIRDKSKVLEQRQQQRAALLQLQDKLAQMQEEQKNAALGDVPPQSLPQTLAKHVSLTQVANGLDTVSSRTENFIVARGLLVSAADALERLMSSWKEVTELAGRTARVSDMIDIFTDVSEGRYVKNVSAESKHILDQLGVVEESREFIELDKVPVVTPNGDVLIKELSFLIKPGMHLLITGPNGCGKSSLFRMLGGLWPVHGGRLVKPPLGDMFYIPQRPYLSEGTLREQFIYPDTHEDMIRKGITDKDLMDILAVVHLDYVCTREGGLSTVNDWREMLSGGEKQRVGMARVFYHRPKYAILDECTSAVSIDVEGRMYLHAKALGITLLTVTHRPSLWKYHTHLLQFDGQGNYRFAELNAEERISLEEEKAKLEHSLSDVPKMQERLNELKFMLGEKALKKSTSRKLK